MNEYYNYELVQDNVVERLLARKTAIEKILQVSENALTNAPEGKLRIGRSRKFRQYYLRNGPSDKEGTYIKSSQETLAKALAQKDYDHRLVNELRQELRAICRFLDDYHPERVDGIFQSLHEKRKALVMPVRLLDIDYIRQWTSIIYEKKGFEEDAPEFYTARGERVRSKSEIMIADALHRHGIPYRYEYPIFIAGLGTVHPDFICLNIRERQEYLWEHCGMMSDSTYSDAAVKKIERYLASGYYPGKNTILSFETSSRPLSSRVIEQNISGYLL
jgi:hypothetical protein